MMRSICALLLVAIPAAGQEPEIPVRKLTVTPAALPDPALKYKLLPEVRDTTPGNAALLYYRAFAPDWSHAIRGDKKLQQTIEDALEKSPAELRPLSDLHFFRSWPLLKEVDRAARRSYCDWELAPRVREDGVALLLPDVQGMRELARYLKLRVKLELADKRFEEAERTLQTGFQMSRHVADAPTLIQALVGAAIAAIMCEEVEDWIKTPEAPNLYWALALPQPFIDLRKSYQGERMFMDNLLPGFREALANPEKAPPVLSSSEWRDKLKSLGEAGSVDAQLFGIALKKFAIAKEYLMAHGRTAAQVEALPVLSVVLLYEVAMYDRLFDEVIKWLGYPFSTAQAGIAAADAALKREVVRSGAPGLSLAGFLLPAVGKVHYASVRADRTINMLRVIEALRMYAAVHGKLPAKLADITEVPVPNDPVTEKPFEYSASGNTAKLNAGPPAGEQAHAGNTRRYEITLAK